MNMEFKIQTLENDLVQLIPLNEVDFASLFQVASDPLLWEQHPQKDRCEEAVFSLFFEEAIENKMAFIEFPAGSQRRFKRLFLCLLFWVLRTKYKRTKYKSCGVENKSGFLIMNPSHSNLK